MRFSFILRKKIICNYLDYLEITLIKVDHNYIYLEFDFRQKTKSARLNTRQKPSYTWVNTYMKKSKRDKKQGQTSSHNHNNSTTSVGFAPLLECLNPDLKHKNPRPRPRRDVRCCETKSKPRF